MQLEKTLTDASKLDSIYTQDSTAYVQTTETPYIPNNLHSKTGYESLIGPGLFAVVFYIFYRIRKMGKK